MKLFPVNQEKMSKFSLSIFTLVTWKYNHMDFKHNTVSDLVRILKKGYAENENLDKIENSIVKG